MESLVQEIRYSIRSLAMRPLVAVVAVLSLSLGIGINTAIFSILDRLVLEPLPLARPGSLGGGLSQRSGTLRSRHVVPRLHAIS